MAKKNFFNLIKSYSNYLLICLTIFACMISFQNCAADFDPEGTSTSSSKTSDASPFAFDMKVDHISLMTCPLSESSVASGGYTIKWGAYRDGLAKNKGGLSLSEDWLNINGNNVAAGLLNILSQSSKNQGVNIVSGFFKDGDYGKGNFALNFNGSSSNGFFLGQNKKLQVDSYLHQLVEQPESKHSYFSRVPIPLASSDPAPILEGTLNRPSVQQITENYDPDEFTYVMKNYDVYSAASLHIGFSYADDVENNKIYLLSSDGTYGRDQVNASIFNFTYGPIGDSRYRYFNTVSELDAKNGRAVNDRWTCPSNLRFMIIRREDVRANGGNIDFTSTPITSTRLSIDTRLQSVINMIDPAYWDIDMTRQLISRKSTNNGGTCYNKSFYKAIDNNQGNHAFQNIIVDYNESLCKTYPSNLNTSIVVNNLITPTLYVCPHYVSICTK